MELLFYLSCVFLALGIYGGLVQCPDEYALALVYLMTVVNTLILVIIVGVLIYG